MLKIEVAVASVHQNCCELFMKMNAKSDMIIANQTNENNFEEYVINGYNVRMISTKTRGVGINRNLGLQLSQGDIILLADEDIIYHEGYDKIIEKAFTELPEADVIIFEMKFIKNGKIIEVDNFNTRRLHLWNGLSFGTYQIAIRRESWLRANINFTDLFGGGCKYSSGEDSAFLIECFYKGLKLYTYNALIGDNIRDTSSWFEGFNEKFFYDKGALAAYAFKKWMQLPIIIYYVYRYKNKGDIKTLYKIRLMLAGRGGIKSIRTYEEWNNHA